MVKVDTRTKKSSERRSRRTTRRPKSLDPMKAFLAAIGTMTGRYQRQKLGTYLAFAHSIGDE